MDYKKTINESDELLFRCLEGTASDSEYEQAWHWVHRSLENKEHYDKMRDAWIASGLLKPVDRNVQSRVWSQIENKILTQKTSGKKIRMNILKWTAVAAVVVLAYLSGTQTSGKYDVRTDDSGEYVIEAPKGGKSVMTLSDGSRVWLNAGSSLQFDKAFNKQNRTLTLQGEAYFDVAQDADRPFSVKASGITIAALGTAFNVKAYPEEDRIETTLVEGSVRIETDTQSKTKSEPVLLKPNQKAVYYKAGQTISVNKNDALDAKSISDVPKSFEKIEVTHISDVEFSTSWKDKRWMVLGERLGDFAVNIERRYDVDLIFENAELENYKISATLEEETIEQLLNAIRLTVPMDYKVERNRVYLSVNQQLKKKYDKLINNK